MEPDSTCARFAALPLDQSRTGTVAPEAQLYEHYLKPRDWLAKG